MRLTAFLVLILSFLAKAQVFQSSPNGPVSDNSPPQSFALAVNGLSSVSPSFGLQSVCLTILHTSCADLEVKLQSPDGTRVTLFSGVGWSEDNFVSTCLSDTGQPVYWAEAPFTGNFRSQMPLGNFNNGAALNGTWKLWVQDRAQGNVGTVVEFSLSFGNAPAPPFSFSESMLPIVVIDGPVAGISNFYKSQARMRIIDNGVGQMNRLSSETYQYDGPIMAEWQGWSSPNYPKKNIDFNLGPAENPSAEAPLLGLPEENDWILKAEYTDRTILRNSLVYETYRQMGGWAPRTRYCEVVLDGEYVGVYVLMEKVKRDKNRVDIAKLTETDLAGDDITGGYIIEMNPTGAQPAWYSAFPPANDATTDFQVEFKHVYPRADKIKPEQQNYIRSFVDGFESALHGPDFTSPVNGYRKYIDVQSFIDFLLLNEFSGNYDSYGRSTYLYKEKLTDGGGLLHMGPPWDYDRTFGFDYPDTFGWVWEITNYYWPFPFWWQRLWSDPAFLGEVECRWRSYREEILSDVSIGNRIDSLSQIIAVAQQRNFRLWPDGSSVDWVQRVQDLKTFISARVAWMDAQLDFAGHLVPDLALPAELQVCAGTEFDGTQPGGPWTYNWRPGPKTAKIILQDSGRYELEVRDAEGCFRRKAIEVVAIRPDAGFATTATAGNSDWAFTADDSALEDYQWAFGDGVVGAGDAVSHAYGQQGDYQVSLTVTDEYGCNAQDSLVLQVNSVGVEDFHVRVFPNPSGDLLMLVAEEDLYENRWVISDATGQVRLQGTVVGVNTPIDVSTLAPGIYYLRAGTRACLMVRSD